MFWRCILFVSKFCVDLLTLPIPFSDWYSPVIRESPIEKIVIPRNGKSGAPACTLPQNCSILSRTQVRFGNPDRGVRTALRIALIVRFPFVGNSASVLKKLIWERRTQLWQRKQFRTVG